MPVSGRTFLQIINAVLPRLREATVAANDSTTYSTLIGSLVNQVKTEIELAYRWRELRDTYNVTTVNGTTSYAFAGSGPDATIMDAWDTKTAREMTLGSFHSFNDKFFGVTTVSTGDPTEYLPAGLDASYDLLVDIWPSPTTTTNTLKFNLYVPQATLTSDSTVVLVPNHVLIEGTIARALMERGDDGGTAADRQEAKYQEMLASAISYSQGHDPHEFDWVPV